MYDFGMGFVMIDWVTGRIDVGSEWSELHGLWDTGQIGMTKPGRVLDKVFGRRLLAEGSHSSTISCRSATGYDLEISGNPAKYFQGHNLFGSADPLGLFFEAGFALRSEGIEFPSPGSFRSYNCRVGLSRVDITRSYRFPSDAAALAWIKEVGKYSRTRVGTGSFSRDTLYFGKNSTYWSAKIYLKSAEVLSRKKGHMLPFSFGDEDRKELVGWSEGVVRLELTLRSRVLKDLGLNFDPMEQWEKYFGRVSLMSGSGKNRDLLERPEVKELSSPVRLALASWIAGDDQTIHELPTATAYRYRLKLRQAVGVDIFGPCPDGGEDISAELDPAGWDPEPIQEYVFEPRAGLKDAYLGR